MTMSERTASGDSNSDWMADTLTPLLFGVGCFVLWEGAVWLLSVPMYILPPPSAIFVQFVQKFPRIWEYTLVTGQETLVGFAAAILLGVPMGLLVAFSPLLRRTFYPLAVTLEMVPKIVFAPVFISWWGFGFTPKIYDSYYRTGRRVYDKTGETSAVLTTYDAETFSTPDCHTVMGWYRKALEMCGCADVKVVEEECRARGGTVCRYRLSWIESARPA